MAKTRKALERASMLQELIPGGDALVWPRAGEGGWFQGPRSLPLILAVVNTKQFRGNVDIASTYLALLAENWGEGLVEIKGESDAAMLAGLRADARGLRGWRDRMRKLEKLELIRIFPRGTQAIGYVVLMHPHDVLQRLRDKRKIDDGMWNLYQSKLRESGVIQMKKETPKVVPFRLRKPRA
jgi:hypothetical protein